MFAADLLVGVVQTDPGATSHRRLRAVPLSSFAEHPDFVRLITQDGGPAALRRSLLHWRQIDDLLELGIGDTGRQRAVAEVDPYTLRITGTLMAGAGTGSTLMCPGIVTSCCGPLSVARTSSW